MYAAAGGSSQELGAVCVRDYERCVWKRMPNNHLITLQPVAVGTSMFQVLEQGKKGKCRIMTLKDQDYTVPVPKGKP